MKFKRIMKKNINIIAHIGLILCFFCNSLFVCLAQTPPVGRTPNAFRPPSVPLVVHSPYFSIWSPGDRLTDKNTEHWTGAGQHLHSLIRIDGKAFRLMGEDPKDVPALKQVSVEVLPTRTIARFSTETVEVTMTFMTPALPDDIDLLSRPVTYLTWEARSADGKPHDVQLYFDASTTLAVNKANQPVEWKKELASGLKVLSVGTVEQPVLKTRGDLVRIDWGYFYLGVPEKQAAQVGFGKESTTPTDFSKNGKLSENRITPPQKPGDDPVVLAMTMNLGKVGAKSVSRHIMLAYDNLFAIKYFKQNLRPYWKRNSMSAEDLLKISEKDYEKLTVRCEKFDNELMADMEQAGGDHYATLGALAYRQTIGMTELVADSHGKPLYFSKEPSSSGNVHTIDVVCPASPLFMLFNPGLLRAMLVPMMDYCNSLLVKHNSCPHDMGDYPIADGCLNGDAEIELMPVEETANMIIMLTAIAQIEGNARLEDKYWPLLTRWAEYLKQKGWDLDAQLCTDDFAGYLPHSVNLSIKSITALGAYAKLADMLGKKDVAKTWLELAQSYAENLTKAAVDGDHTLLALDRPGTWSQKYNLVWDKLLGLNLFPSELRQKELAWYKKVMNPYGVPLDSRFTLTIPEWSVWSACLTDDRNEFMTFIDPIYRFMDESPDRVPMGDRYETKTPKWLDWKARPTVGSVFLWMLSDKTRWDKWAKRAPVIENNWAPFPITVSPDTVLENSKNRWHGCYYTTTKPGGYWKSDHKHWRSLSPTCDWWKGWGYGFGGFGSVVNEESGIRTKWDGNELWLRRSFAIWGYDIHKNLVLNVRHAGPVEIYINEVLAAKLTGSSGETYETVAINPEAMATLKATDELNTLAVHCGKAETEPAFDLGITVKK